MSVVALSGQGCSLATRLLVQDSIYDEVARRVVELARSIRVGDPFDPSSMIVDGGLTVGPNTSALAGVAPPPPTQGGLRWAIVQKVTLVAAESFARVPQ